MSNFTGDPGANPTHVEPLDAAAVNRPKNVSHSLPVQLQLRLLEGPAHQTARRFAVVDQQDRWDHAASS